MKLFKNILLLFIILIIILSGCKSSGGQSNNKDTKKEDPNTIADINSGEITLNSRAVNSSFYLKDENKWKREYIKGINVGLTLPTTDLNNPDVPYDVYTDWFKDISAMNINTVRVFTIMNPDFYNALYDFNQKCKDPLYLIQGIWFNENYLYDIGDAYGENGIVLTQFKRACEEATDILNGNLNNYTYGRQSVSYKKDVSEYVIGYVLGLEYPPEFVNTTNKNNPSKTYAGEYLLTQNASPFEAFLCEIGDSLIKYESENYKKQHPVAFLNWSPLDTLTHTNEPFKEENDGAVLNTENILKTDKYYAGLFAAIDIYPYYPEFMNYQKEYLDYKEDGKPNPYRAYLKDLHKTYTVPVIVAEFGIPTSRGISHESAMGYNQGGIDEQTQGKMVLKMMQDINCENYAGGLIFSWQDEWFKQVWNIYKYAPKNALQRASNAMVSEQFYGIVAYDPGEGQSISYPDGDIMEWTGDYPAFSNNQMDLFTKSDERYLYILCKIKEQFNFDQKTAYIALGTTGRGNSKDKERNLTFDKPTDFVIELNGKNNTKIKVDTRYDYFNFFYCYKKKIFSPANSSLNSGIFNPIKTFISNEIVLPIDKKTIQPKAYESGKLHLGNGNPNSGDFNNLTDFCYKDGNFEIRIPWYLLNIYDPANMLIADDFYKTDGVNPTQASGFYIGGATNSSNINMSEFNIDGYTTATFHKRLKKSYTILQKGLEKIT